MIKKKTHPYNGYTPNKKRKIEIATAFALYATWVSLDENTQTDRNVELGRSYLNYGARAVTFVK